MEKDPDYTETSDRQRREKKRSTVEPAPVSAPIHASTEPLPSAPILTLPNRAECTFSQGHARGNGSDDDHNQSYALEGQQHCHQPLLQLAVIALAS